jgi:hypothetical protein
VKRKLFLLLGCMSGVSLQPVLGQRDTWRDVGGGMMSSDAQVHAVTLYNGDLIAAGSFSSADGQSMNNIARWDGTSWQPMGDGLYFDPNWGDARPYVDALRVYQGSLIAAGQFSFATPSGGVSRLARWTGCLVYPILNVEDFICFVNQFTAALQLPHAEQVIHYANCDESTIAPMLNVDDFVCFMNHFAAGCP